MTRITIGQHYPTGSVIHGIDSRVKLFGVLLYVTSLLFVNHFAGYLLALLFVVAVIRASKVPLHMVISGMRPVIFMLAFAATINIFFTPGENVVFAFGFIQITAEGLRLAGLMASRLTLLVAGTSVLTLTSSPMELTDGIETGLAPLKKLKVPVHDIAMMMTIALRFIPTLADEVDKIIKAQKARGADFDTGNILKRAKSLIPVLVPPFVSALKRADELATAMDSRCYRGDEIKRTKMKQMKMTPADWLAAGVVVSVCVVMILTRIL